MQAEHKAREGIQVVLAYLVHRANRVKLVQTVLLELKGPQECLVCKVQSDMLVSLVHLDLKEKLDLQVPKANWVIQASPD